jgi:methylenetetrahydrofolate reductase (NADPH)
VIGREEMKVIEFYKRGKAPVLSIEVSPVLNGESLDPIFNTISSLGEFEPAWCSVTCGALGRPRGGTIPIAGRIRRECGIESVVHMTCMGRSRQDMENSVMDMKYEGIENVLAVRGDPPKGDNEFRPHPSGHRFAHELVRQIKLLNRGQYQGETVGPHREGLPTSFCMGVAGYPEGHPECPDKRKDLEHLRMKVDEGADYIVTQLFFDADHYLRFVEDGRKIGIQVPVVPGVMPIEDWPQLKFILGQGLGVDASRRLVEKLQNYHAGRDKVSAQKFGREYIVSMCETLLKGGAPGIHLYTMNSPERAGGVIEELYPRYFAAAQGIEKRMHNL